MKKHLYAAMLSSVFVMGSAQAAIVNVDLSAATIGSLITGTGASFAQTFVGQGVFATSITGSPSNPLTLDASGGPIEVVDFDPGVAPESNSLLTQPDNAAPLSGLLTSYADSLAFTAGYGDNPGSPFTIDFYAADGTLVDMRTIVTLSGYANYAISGIAAYQGFTISDNNDDRGLRFQNFSYNSVPTPQSGVPEPASWALLIGGFGLVGVSARRRRSPIAQAV